MKAESGLELEAFSQHFSPQPYVQHTHMHTRAHTHTYRVKLTKEVCLCLRVQVFFGLDHVDIVDLNLQHLQ